MGGSAWLEDIVQLLEVLYLKIARKGSCFCGRMLVVRWLKSWSVSVSKPADEDGNVRDRKYADLKSWTSLSDLVVARVFRITNRNALKLLLFSNSDNGE